MARNGSGTFSLYSPGNPVVTGTTISSTTHNATMSDIATALTQSISSTGVTTPTANLPMGGFRHTGVGNANAQACYGSVTDIQNGSLVTLSSVGGTADAITATAPQTVAAYAAGQKFRFVAVAANTGAATINISSLGAKSITKYGATALHAGDIANGATVEIVYDGTQFQMTGGFALTTVDWLTGANIASASTINLDAATGNRVHVTGTTQINAVTLTKGPRTVIFDGILTLAHHATNNFLPGGINITTAAGDVAIYESDGTTVRCVAYTRADGRAVNPASLILIASLTPTAAANVDFLSAFLSSANNYRIIGEGLLPSGNDSLLMQFAAAGVADSGANYVSSALAEDTTPKSGGATAILLSSSVLAAGTGLNFAIDVFNVNDATNLKAVAGKSILQTAATPTFILSGCHGAYYAANAASGVRFLWNGGSNFAATGKIRVYGYSNT